MKTGQRRFSFFSCWLLLVFVVTACQGIPLRSVPRLYRLQGELLTMDPAALRLAVQLDARLAPPPTSSPQLVIHLTTKRRGSVDNVERRLPMHYLQTAGAVPGLPLPDSRRRWLVYSLTPESRAELQAIQNRVRQGRDDGGEGGTLGLGIDQSGLLENTTDMMDSRWETWLQVSTQEGFFELWSGTVADLLRQARAAQGH